MVHRLAEPSATCYNLHWLFPDDSTFVVEERTSPLSLPIKIYHIGCYGNEKRLINCTHKVYRTLFFFYFIFGVDTPQPEIVSIKCSEDNPDTSVTPVTGTICENCSNETSSVTITSSSTSTINDSQSTVVAAIVLVVLCFSVVIGLVIGYIIFKYIQQKKGRFVHV